MALYGVYGSHTPESCPVNNKKIAEVLVDFSNADLASVAGKYKINDVIGQFHSALEHTFLWVVDAEDPHLLEKFCIDTGLAKFNYLKFVPLITFGEGVIPRIKEIHNL